MRKTLSFLLLGYMAACGPLGTNGSSGSNGTNGMNGSQGPQGPAGPQGPMGNPGKDGNNGTGETLLAALAPSIWPAGRTVTVELTGVATHFKTNTTVDFADIGITVGTVTVGSNANLELPITITPQATIGAH